MVRLVELGSGVLAGDGRVVRAQDAPALLDIVMLRQRAQEWAAHRHSAASEEAESLIVQARHQAAELVAQAHRRAEEILAAARIDAQAAAVTAAQDRLLEIATRENARLAQEEERIVGLALDIARTVVEGLDRDDVTLRAASRAFRLAGRGNPVRLRVAPAMVNLVRENLAAILPPDRGGLDVDVVGCESVRSTGAVLETDCGIVDATTESHFAALERALRPQAAAD